MTGKDGEEESAYLAWAKDASARIWVHIFFHTVLRASQSGTIGTCVNNEVCPRFSPKLDGKTTSIV